jgi:hypothetical protein
LSFRAQTNPLPRSLIAFRFSLEAKPASRVRTSKKESEGKSAFSDSKKAEKLDISLLPFGILLTLRQTLAGEDTSTALRKPSFRLNPFPSAWRCRVHCGWNDLFSVWYFPSTATTWKGNCRSTGSMLLR